jgi:hypothetical protein
MRNLSSILVVVGSLCLMITLVLAWCLVGVRSSAFMKKMFPNYQNLFVTNQTAAQSSIGAIRAVVHAVRFNVPLEKP